MGKRQRWSTLDKSTVKLSHLRKAYEVYNQTVGKSPNTIHWYNQKLELFDAFIADLQNRSVKHANNPAMGVKTGPLSTSYIQGFARALRAFATWLHVENYTDTNVLKPLKPPRIQRKVIQVLSDEEVARLLARFDQDDPFGARDYTIIWTMLDTGLRASELCGLAVEDAHIEQGYVKVLGKGNKERLVPIGAKTQTVLLRWRDVYRALFLVVEAQHLFLSASGGALTAPSLHLIVKRAGRSADIPRLHSHLLRHTFATNYLVKEVGDPLRLQQILGHTSLEMVRHYVAIASVERSLQDARSSRCGHDIRRYRASDYSATCACNPDYARLSGLNQASQLTGPPHSARQASLSDAPKGDSSRSSPLEPLRPGAQCDRLVSPARRRLSADHQLASRRWAAPGEACSSRLKSRPLRSSSRS